VFDAKRLIGRKFDDPEVQADIKHFPFKVFSKGGKPYVRVEYRGEEKEFVSIFSSFAPRIKLVYYFISSLRKKFLLWFSSR
jgi:molecular chaperone DnaK (HSP70)